MKNNQRLTQEEFVNRVNALNKGFRVKGKYVNSKEPVEIECQFGHIWSPSPSNLMRGSGCIYCSGKKSIVGETDLWTTHPNVAAILKNPDDGHRYTHGSSKKLDFICPDCHSINHKNVDMVCRYGFVCSSCSDGVSYPNKFSRAFLDQLPVYNRCCEYSPKWAHGKLYDNYFEYNGEKYILEMDGIFHYPELSEKMAGFYKRAKTDEEKTRMAIDHGINIIRIECKKSSCEYIKQNILNSEINEIFDLSNIDWILCDMKAQKSIVKQVCDMYQSGVHNITQLKDIFYLNRGTIANYLKRGASLGLCDYTIEKSRKYSRDKIMRSVDLIDDNGEIIHHFKSLTECSIEMQELYGMTFNVPNIIKACKTKKSYKNFNFRYST